jgi:hypothetical protein
VPLIVRERLHLIPGILWWNFSKHGYTSTSVDLGLATWNSKLGWTVHIAHGVSWRQSRHAARYPHRRWS